MARCKLPPNPRASQCGGCEVRAAGPRDAHGVRDWTEAITGKDPGAGLVMPEGIEEVSPAEARGQSKRRRADGFRPLWVGGPTPPALRV